MVTRLQRVEKHPTLDSLLSVRDNAPAPAAPQAQSPEQQRALFSVLAEAFGGTVVHVPREASQTEAPSV